MQTFKLFVSSPGDVMVERRRVENVASRLNGEFAGVARLQVIRWETKNYQAFSTFQAQIPRSVDCDLVIGILKWRLGTELPPEFSEKLPDGHSFPSGTAYEILTAIEKRQKGLELPDVYVFRFAGSSPAVAIEDPDRARIERDWQILKGFMQEWFLSAQGHFKAAFNPYTSEDDFEAQLEQLLRGWLAEKVAGERGVRWPIEVKGSPFCGLAAFGARHAPVFFGRSHDIARAVDLWREAGQRQSPYLLVIGASGSGKSSLARAGAVPRLTTPGVIREVDVWRVAAMRPSDSPQGPFAALAAALMQSEAGLSLEEQGRGAALPEIGLGDSRTPAAFTAVLRHADRSAIQPIVNALDHVAKAEHDRGNYTRDVRCDLVLLIDQLDELFAASVGDAERDGFLDLVAAMAATGRIWVVTTLRADLYPRMLGQPTLKKLKELGATYDLAPPGPVELAEIVRSPAEAAGLVFETDAASGQRLDTRLLIDAEQPDMLPLVQLALSRLFEGRQKVGGELRLPFAVYESLGGLKGIIDEAGERAITSVGEQERARLPRLLRQLAVPALNQGVAASDALTIRAVPLAQAAPDAVTRTLLDALVTARLLTVSGNEAEGKDKSIAPVEAQVRLTHQRVLEDWGRARTIVVESTDFYRVRSDLEENYRRWNNGGRRGELLLARGLPLAEAENLVGKYGDELTPGVRDYVKASRQRANRAQVIGWSAAAVFALVAIGAGFEWKTASEQRAAAETARQEAQIERDRAEEQTRIALSNEAEAKRQKESRDNQFIIANESFKLGLVSHRRVAYRFETEKNYDAALKELADEQGLLQSATIQMPNDPWVIREMAQNKKQVGDLLNLKGDASGALESFGKSRELLEGLVKSQPGDAAFPADLLETRTAIIQTLIKLNQRPEALNEFLAAKKFEASLPAGGPRTPDMEYGSAKFNAGLGDELLFAGRDDEALAAFGEARLSLNNLVAQDPKNENMPQWRASYVQTQEEIGGILERQNKPSDALIAYQEARARQKEMVLATPSNQALQTGLVGLDDHVADLLIKLDQVDNALVVQGEALETSKAIVAEAPGNIERQDDLAVSYARVGNWLIRKQQYAEAIVNFRQALGLRQALLKTDPDNRRSRLIENDLRHLLGDALFAEGSYDEALAFYRDAVGSGAKLINANAADTEILAIATLDAKIAGVLLKKNDQDGAVKAYRAALDSLEKFMPQHPENTAARAMAVWIYGSIGDVLLAQDQQTDASMAFEKSLTLAKAALIDDPATIKAWTWLPHFVQRLGHSSFDLILKKMFQKALEDTELALSIAPGEQFIEINRADALMFLDRTEEARSLYLKYRGDKNAEAGILGDFAQFKKAGLSRALMDEIEGRFKPL